MMAQFPSLVVYMNPSSKGHARVYAIYSETSVKKRRLVHQKVYQHG